MTDQAFTSMDVVEKEKQLSILLDFCVTGRSTVTSEFEERCVDYGRRSPIPSTQAVEECTVLSFGKDVFGIHFTNMEDDQCLNAKMVDAEALTPECDTRESCASSLSVSILQLVHEMRLRNGLRRNDLLRYQHYCRARLRRSRQQMHLTNGRGRFSRRSFPLETANIRYLELLVLNVERCWAAGSYLKSILDRPSSSSHVPRRFKPQHLRHYIHRRFRKALLYAKTLLQFVKLHGTKTSLLTAEAYTACQAGTLFVELRRWKDAAKHLLLAQNYIMQLQHLTPTRESSYDATDLYLKSIEALLRTTTHYLKRQGVAVEDLLPQSSASESSTTTQEVMHMLLWRGVSVPLSLSLLEFSKTNDIVQFYDANLDPFIQANFTFNQSTEPSLWTMTLEKYSSLDNIMEKSSSKIREYLLDTNMIVNQNQLFVLESLVRDWVKISSIESHCYLMYIILATYRSQGKYNFTREASKVDDTEYPAGLLLLLADVVLQILDTFHKEISSSGLPTSLEESLRETEPFLLSCLVLSTRVVRDVRALALCLTLGASLREREEAYVLMKRVVERRQEFNINEQDLALPDKPCWVSSPFHHISTAIGKLDHLISLCLPTVDLLISSHLMISKSLHTTEAPTLQNVLHEVETSLQTVSRNPELSPIPMKPMFFDLASSFIDDADFMTATPTRLVTKTTGLVEKITSWWKH